MSRHQGAKDLFLAVLERPIGERAAFLADACGEDTALRQEVESLLAFHDSGASGDDLPPAAGPGARLAFAPGDVFAGRYRMVTRLGQGGMGDVWRADDLILDTPVALKLIRSTSQAGRERLLEEVRLARQITHPAVCRVFDVGEADDEVFFSMEFVKGQDLSALLRHAGRLAPDRVMDIARQLCAGLEAAHEQGVLHRDLKPANILIDERGQVRITDFGIAVPAGTVGRGMAGTPLYMAPEQRTPGATLSRQTDLYALGVVLYELATGRHPAQTLGPDGVVTPPSTFTPEVDTALENVILWALAVNPDDRPSSAAAMAAALPKVEPPEPGVIAAGKAAGQRPAWPGRWLLVAAVAAVIIGGAATYVLPSRTPPLTELDTIVLADFTNTTDEPLFDSALKVALAVALEQSPFLKVFPDERVRETLRLMERPPEQRITREVAREIARREHLKATLSGSIASLGRNYVLALEATNAQTGDVMAREQVEATSKEQVLTALGTAATRLRERLGESLASLRAFDVPLPRATTPSLEALSAYALALEEGRVSIRVSAIPHLQRAIELDPNFALAQALLSGVYANTGQSALAPAHSKRAFELRDRVSERERYFISWRYYRDALQDWPKALDLARAWTAAYPREAFAFNSLGLAAELIGNLEEAEPALRQAIYLDPKFVPPHGNLGDVLMSLGRVAEAKEVVRQAIESGIDYVSVHRVGYLVAFLEGDAAAMASHLNAARKSREAIESADWSPRVAAFSGRLAQAREEFRAGVQQALQMDLKELAARYSVEEAQSSAMLGRCEPARVLVKTAVDWSRDSTTLDSASRVLAWCGDGAASAQLDAELKNRYPDAALRLHVSLPINDAVRAIRGGDLSRGLSLLESIEPFESSSMSRLWPAILRGHAYMLRKEPGKAVTEFQYGLDHRGESPDSVLYPILLLGRARAAVANNDPDGARTHYAALLAIWKDADGDLQPVIEARRELAALR